MPPAVCVFNGTRECFLCLCAVAVILPAQGRDENGFPAHAEHPGSAGASGPDGIWRTPYPGAYTIGGRLPTDQVYLDQGNRVVQVVEHLHPLQLVPVRRNCASLIETRIGTIFASRTQVGDQLLICYPEEVEEHWKQIQVRTASMKMR